MLNTGVISQQQIDDGWQKVAHWKKPNWEQFKDEGEQINQALAEVVSAQEPPDSDVFQALVKRHHAWVSHFWIPTKETYIGLAQMYLDHPDYRAFYNRYHPYLAEYLVTAIKIFAERELS